MKALLARISQLELALEGIAERPNGYHDPSDYERGYGDAWAAKANMARVALKELLPDAVGLAREGHRFIRRGSQFMWSHPNLIQPADVDCTDMDDERFEREVAEHGLPF